MFSYHLRTLLSLFLGCLSPLLSLFFFLPNQLTLPALLLSQSLYHGMSPRGTAMKEGICSSSQDESDKETALLLRLEVLPEQKVLVDEITAIKTSSGE